jgi:4-amino-4-deoxy-L-arabinose transferase-like glycosyltransferase
MSDEVLPRASELLLPDAQPRLEPARIGPATHTRSRRMRALGRVPRAAWLCALIAFLNASAWALIVPPFEGKDEADHFAYVEQLVENHKLPENGSPNGHYSAEENLVLEGLHFGQVVHAPQRQSITTAAEQRTLIEDVHAGASTLGSGEAGIATSEPPLYYTLQIVPYLIASGNILVQLQLMRLVGALFAALTALFTFLFLREILPRAPWAATVAALCVALQPAFAFMSGSVNPDSMLIAVAAAVFLCLARAFRRGLTLRLAVALGVLTAVGFLTKLNYLGFGFGVYCGLAVLAVGAARSRGPRALLAPLLAAGIGILPVGAYVLRNVLETHPTLGIVSKSTLKLEPTSLFHAFSYVWQFYLPRLPGMTHYFLGVQTYKDIWFDRSVGLYGWMDTMFPGWVDNVALVPAAVVALLAARGLLARRRTLRRRLPELGTYAAILLGVLLLIGVSSYEGDALEHGPAFSEPRYLLPLLPLFAAVLAFTVRGAGRRWAPVVGAGLVVLIFGYDLVSQLQVIARYYG